MVMSAGGRTLLGRSAAAGRPGRPRAPRRRLIGLAAALCAAAIMCVAAGPTAAHAAAAPDGTAVLSSRCTAPYPFNSHVCIWRDKAFSGTRWKFFSSQTSLRPSGAADLDGSVALIDTQNANMFVRLYYDTSYFGAWACFTVTGGTGRWLYNLAHYTFKNGRNKAGYGQELYHHVKSFSMNYSAPCTNGS